jgi:hypothetical protein
MIYHQQIGTFREAANRINIPLYSFQLVRLRGTVLCATTISSLGITVMYWLAVCTSGCVATFEKTVNPIATPHPLHITETKFTAAKILRVHFFTRCRHRYNGFDPVFGNQLNALPITLLHHQLTEFRHITSG